MIQGNKQWILSQLEQTLGEDGYYVVDVISAGRPHTRNQQDRFYKVARILSEYTGYTLQETKSVLTAECFGEPRGITGLTTKEMADLIDTAQRIVAENGIEDIT